MYVEDMGRGVKLLLCGLGLAYAGLCQPACALPDSPKIDVLRSAVKRDFRPNCLVRFSAGGKTVRTTPLVVASYYGDAAVVRELVRLQADANARGDGDTPLITALRQGSAAQSAETAASFYGVVEALLAAGANARQRDSQGIPALVIACGWRKGTAGPALVKGGRTADVLRALLAAGADPNAGANTGDTALMSAVKNDDAESARLLLQHGAKVRRWGSEGSTLDVAPPQAQQLAEELRVRYEAELPEVPASPVPVKTAITGMENLLRRAQSPDANRAVALFRQRWKPRTGPAPLPDVLAIGMTRDLYAMDVAVWKRDAALLQRVADDLKVKAEDCSSREEGLAGNVPVTIRTIGGGGEISGLRLRYVERFLWDLRDVVRGFDTQWHECSRLSAAVKEPVLAGDYVVVAITREGKMSEPKFIEVAKNRPAVFDVAVQ